MQAPTHDFHRRQKYQPQRQISRETANQWSLETLLWMWGPESAATQYTLMHCFLLVVFFCRPPRPLGHRRLE